MKKKMNPLKYMQTILVNLIFLSIGILFFIEYETVWVAIYILSIISLTLLGLSQLFSFIKVKKTRSFNEYLPMLSSFCFAIFIFIFPLNFFKFVHFIIGWYIIINALIGFINFYVYRRDSLKGSSWIFIKSCIDLLFGLTLILSPREKLWILSLFAGSYFIFTSLVEISEAIKDLLPDASKNKVRRRLTVSAPILLSALIPQRFFITIKELVKHNKIQLSLDAYHDDKADLEVFIYLKESGPESLGHVDICFNNKIYSYGCHDPENRKLFGTLGDGVLIVADRNKFLQHAIDGEHKTIIGCKITLSDSEKNVIQTRIDELIKRTIPWKPKAELAFENKKDPSIYTDYASRVYTSCTSTMYKFTKGKYKTYFVFSTNCVLIADYLIRTPELDLIKTSGIVTPGSYISFLNQEYHRPNSVVSKISIYQKK